MNSFIVFRMCYMSEKYRRSDKGRTISTMLMNDPQSDAVNTSQPANPDDLLLLPDIESNQQVVSNSLYNTGSHLYEDAQFWYTTCWRYLCNIPTAQCLNLEASTRQSQTARTSASHTQLLCYKASRISIYRGPVWRKCHRLPRGTVWKVAAPTD